MLARVCSGSSLNAMCERLSLAIQCKTVSFDYEDLEHKVSLSSLPLSLAQDCDVVCCASLTPRNIFASLHTWHVIS